MGDGLMYLVVVDYNDENVPIKINEFDSEADAANHVTLLKFDMGYSKAFYCSHPGGDPNNWRVNNNLCIIDKHSQVQAEWVKVCRKRNALLSKCDWRFLSDTLTSDEWYSYRKSLRDVTRQKDPFDLEWPLMP